MVIFIFIVSIIYARDAIGLIRERRIRDISILSFFVFLILMFGIFYLSDPYRESFISKLFSLIKVEY